MLAVFSVPESERQKRHVLRTQLARLGFGIAAPGLWIAPADLRDAASCVLRRYELADYADLFHAEHLAFGDLRTKVAQWWEAFADYVRMLTDWRRLPYLDPGLPAELLPKNWNGTVAAEMFFTLKS